MLRLQLALSIASLACLSGEASAFCRLTTADPSASAGCPTQGEGLTWDRSCISYTVVPPAHDDLPLEALRDVIDASFGAWAAADCGAGSLPLALGQTQQLGECSTAQYNLDDGNTNAIMFVNAAEEENFPLDAFGLTLVWHDPESGKIFDADIQLNHAIAPFAICDASCEGGVSDLANVVTHEVGHFLGLGHSQVHEATMSSMSLLGDTDKRSLEADDHDGVCAIYGGRPEPTCRSDDYAPDRGFRPQCVIELPPCDPDAGLVPGEECMEPEPKPKARSSSGGCSARTGAPSRTTLGGALLALGALALVKRRRSPRRAR